MNTTQLESFPFAANPLAVIDKAIAELELTSAQYADAVKSYEAIAAVLRKIHPALEIIIFPQGSMRLGTTVRPIQGERFDLDMVCLVTLSGTIYQPEQIFNLVWEALGQDETYRHLRRKKNRCIRIEYADGRKFYLDVTPAVPDWAKSTLLYVPDRELKKWFSSHPIGFCDKFKKAGEALPIIRRPMLQFANRSLVLANASAHVEPMPQHGAFDKTPLQRIVQILKGDRNKYFQNNTAYRPSSILLTTLTMHSYSHFVTEPVADLLEFVAKVVAKLPEFIQETGTAGFRKFFVMNPVNSEENFAEDWTEEHYQHFLAWHKRFAEVLQKLNQSRGQGFGTDEMLKTLAPTFGTDRVIRAAKELGVNTNALNDAGKLCSIGGTLGVVGAAVPKTIYYGGEK